MKKNQKLTADKENLTKEKTDLTNKNAELQRQVKDLQDSKQVLENVKTDLTNENTKLKNEKTELTEKNQRLTTEKTELNNKITGLSTEKDNLTRDKENLTAALSTAKGQAEQTSQKLNELERRHAPYQKLEKLYEVFLEVKDRLNFRFLEETHSAMDLIAHVLSDSKYYVEEFYKKTQQELRNKNSDKGEKLVALFDLLFECIKDKKFKRLEAPRSYNSACITLYPEQSSTGNIQRVVLRGYSYNDKIMHSIVDMGG